MRKCRIPRRIFAWASIGGQAIAIAKIRDGAAPRNDLLIGMARAHFGPGTADCFEAPETLRAAIGFDALPDNLREIEIGSMRRALLWLAGEIRQSFRTEDLLMAKRLEEIAEWGGPQTAREAEHGG